MAYTVGEIIIETLTDLGVQVVFGIPGVHSVELYRGLAQKNIRHITPRHEQGAGFMADGYARRSGMPGVCFVITGPGLTNIITPMAQAYADRIPMLVISTINPTPELGKNSGLLHALPDQSKLAKSVSLKSYTITNPKNASKIVSKAFFETLGSRKGPVHIEIPTNILEERISNVARNIGSPISLISKKFKSDLLKFVKAVESEESILIFAGGGAVNASEELSELSEKLCAPVILTINARGLMSSSSMALPASPSLPVVRTFIKNYDIAIVIGSELGPTDYDMFGTGEKLKFKKIIRIDTDPNPNTGTPKINLNITQDSKLFLQEINRYLLEKNLRRKRLKSDVEKMVSNTKAQIRKNLTDLEKKSIALIEGIYLLLPKAVIVGDSTKPVYAGNDFIDPPDPKTWFNAATGFGALGYAPPSAIGAQIADPESQVICLVGDGGLQFSLTEIGSALDENLPIIYLIWNNHGYKEISDFMDSKNIERIGVTPSPPNFKFIAEAYSIPYFHLTKISSLRKILDKATKKMREKEFKPCIIEVDEHNFSLGSQNNG